MFQCQKCSKLFNDQPGDPGALTLICEKCTARPFDIKCVDCDFVDYSDADFTPQQRENFRCAHCERVLMVEMREAALQCKTALHSDQVNHPSHYKGKGIECIQVIEAFDLNFNLGNAVKYVLRAGKKEDRQKDLKKAIWYLNRELEIEK